MGSATAVSGIGESRARGGSTRQPVMRQRCGQRVGWHDNPIHFLDSLKNLIAISLITAMTIMQACKHACGPLNRDSTVS
jgi:hypothetical protein